MKASGRHLIAVDPGIDRCGLAVFWSDRLVHVDHLGDPLGSREDPVVRAWATAKTVVDDLSLRWRLGDRMMSYLLLVEWPKILMPGKSKGGGDDILLLAAVCGALTSLASEAGATVGSVTPFEWKQSMTKTVLSGRVHARLDEEERRTLSARLDRIPEGRRHNAIDAVGIGLFALGRLHLPVDPG